MLKQHFSSYFLCIITFSSLVNVIPINVPSGPSSASLMVTQLLSRWWKWRMEFDTSRSMPGLSPSLSEAENILQQFHQVDAVLQYMRKWHQHCCIKVKLGIFLQRKGNDSWKRATAAGPLNLTWTRAQAQIRARIVNCSKPRNRGVCKDALGVMGCQHFQGLECSWQAALASRFHLE